MEQTGDAPDFPTTTWRMVVPEEEFGEGKHPFGMPTNVWRQLRSDDVQAFETVDAADPSFASLLLGPAKDPKTEDAEQKVCWQQGDLECAVQSGTSKLDQGFVKTASNDRVFRHDQVPFGLAGLKLELTLEAGENKNSLPIELSLRDHGKDAKSKLPGLLQ